MLNSAHGDFVRSIERMNQMYRLQVSTVPTLAIIENCRDGRQVVIKASERLHNFRHTLMKEIDEIDAIIEKAEQLEMANTFSRDTALDVLTAIADVTADITVFCTSEQRKFGLPPAEVMHIVMASNSSKLQPDGTAKYDDYGKFLKGPNYWKPEPAIKDLITAMAEGYELDPAAVAGSSE